MLLFGVRNALFTHLEKNYTSRQLWRSRYEFHRSVFKSLQISVLELCGQVKLILQRSRGRKTFEASVFVYGAFISIFAVLDSHEVRQKKILDTDIVVCSNSSLVFTGDARINTRHGKLMYALVLVRVSCPFSQLNKASCADSFACVASEAFIDGFISINTYV